MSSEANVKHIQEYLPVKNQKQDTELLEDTR